MAPFFSLKVSVFCILWTAKKRGFEHQIFVLEQMVQSKDDELCSLKTQIEECKESESAVDELSAAESKYEALNNEV